MAMKVEDGDGSEIDNHDWSPDISSSDEEGLASYSRSEVVVKCIFCHKSFFGQIGLDHHMERFHPDLVDRREKIPPGPAVQTPGAVAGTSASTSTSTSGKKQRKIAERNDKCLICDKAFRSRKELKRHEKTAVHKKKLKEMSARDEAVPGSSTSATVAKGPKKIAGRIDKCEVCSKAFRSQKELKRHEKTSTHKIIMGLQMQTKEQ